MLKKIWFAAAVLVSTTLTAPAIATTCPAYTYTLTNGTTADATQVMADFNTIMTCANGALAPLASPSFTGNVGIGVAAPSYPFQMGTALIPASAFTPTQALIDDSPSNTTSGAIAAFGIVSQPVPASNSSATFEGSNVDLSVPSSATVTYSTLVGMQDSVKYSGAGVLGTMHGLSVTANYASASTSGTVRGIVPTAINSSTGSVQNLQGAIVTAQNSGSGGVTGGAYGLYSRVLASGSGALTGFAVYGVVQNSGTAVLPAAYGVMGEPRNSSTGTITVAYGGNFDVQNTGGGTITTGYGVYIGGVAGTTKYSLYASDGTAPSYFAGSIGIGTTAPAVALAVVGDIRVGTTGTNGCLQNFAGTGLVGTCVSDAALKIVRTDVTGVLDRIANLRLVRFNWNGTAATVYRNSTASLNTGFIAQAVEVQFPELVSRDAHGYRQLDYTTLNLYGLEAIKELKSESDRKSAEIAQLRARLERTERLLAAAAGEQAASIRDLRAQMAALRRETRLKMAAR